jgi:hypothetical protein
MRQDHLGPESGFVRACDACMKLHKIKAGDKYGVRRYTMVGRPPPHAKSEPHNIDEGVIKQTTEYFDLDAARAKSIQRMEQEKLKGLNVKFSDAACSDSSDDEVVSGGGGGVSFVNEKLTQQVEISLDDEIGGKTKDRVGNGCEDVSSKSTLSGCSSGDDSSKSRGRGRGRGRGNASNEGISSSNSSVNNAVVHEVSVTSSVGVGKAAGSSGKGRGRGVVPNTSPPPPIPQKPSLLSNATPPPRPPPPIPQKPAELLISPKVSSYVNRDESSSPPPRIPPKPPGMF